jgi:heavy metal sensor kinase
MFFKPLKGLIHTVGFRLTLWYSGMFILSMSLLFGLVYVILSTSLTRQDQETIQAQLRELASVYKAGGLEALESEVTREKKFEKRSSFFVRLADPSNRTVLLILPYQWAEFDLKALEEKPLESRLELASRTGKGHLEIASARLAFGYTLQVGKSTEDTERVLRNLRRTCVGALVPFALLSFAGGIFLSRRALRPVRQLTETVRSISSGRMDARVPILRTRDELGDLIILFNSMVEKIEQLVHGMKDSLDNVAHDLRTPMTRMRGVAEMALRSGADEAGCREALADCIEESDKILRMLDTLMDISEAESGAMNLNLEEIKVCVLIEEVVELYRYVAEDKAVSLETACPEDLAFLADPVRIRQAVGNLIDNALKYTPRGGRVKVSARSDSGRVWIAVEDTGIGMGQEELPRIWGRLYRSDRSRAQKGLGLGLSLVKAIVEAHGGEVRVSSERGKGSLFTLSFP